MSKVTSTSSRAARRRAPVVAVIAIVIVAIAGFITVSVAAHNPQPYKFTTDGALSSDSKKVQHADMVWLEQNSVFYNDRWVTIYGCNAVPPGVEIIGKEKYTKVLDQDQTKDFRDALPGWTQFADHFWSYDQVGMITMYGSMVELRLPDGYADEDLLTIGDEVYLYLADHGMCGL